MHPIDFGFSDQLGKKLTKMKGSPLHIAYKPMGLDHQYVDVFALLRTLYLPKSPIHFHPELQQFVRENVADRFRIFQDSVVEKFPILRTLFNTQNGKLPFESLSVIDLTIKLILLRHGLYSDTAVKQCALCAKNFFSAYEDLQITSLDSTGNVDHVLNIIRNINSVEMRLFDDMKKRLSTITALFKKIPDSFEKKVLMRDFFAIRERHALKNSQTQKDDNNLCDKIEIKLKKMNLHSILEKQLERLDKTILLLPDSDDKKSWSEAIIKIRKAHTKENPNNELEDTIAHCDWIYERLTHIRQDEEKYSAFVGRAQSILKHFSRSSSCTAFFATHFDHSRSYESRAKKILSNTLLKILENKYSNQTKYFFLKSKIKENVFALQRHDDSDDKFLDLFREYLFYDTSTNPNTIPLLSVRTEQSAEELDDLSVIL